MSLRKGRNISARQKLVNELAALGLNKLQSYSSVFSGRYVQSVAARKLWNAEIIPPLIAALGAASS
jgi:hypothetical protein